MAENLTYYDSPLTGEALDAAFRKIPQIDASVAAAAKSAELAESWTQGGTGARVGEDTDNARYWCERAQMADGALGWYADAAALKSAHPTGRKGQWAVVGAGDVVFVWSPDAGAWVESGASMYKALFSLDHWSGSGPYTQTAAVTPVNGGPPVTAHSVLCGGFGVDDTLGEQAYTLLLSAAADLGKTRDKTFGAGTLTLSAVQKPLVDAELYFMARKDGV